MTTRPAFGILRFAFAVVALSAVAVGQEPPPRPTFRTEPGYVRVDVHPTANGVPVDDLQQDELEVLEDNVPQAIDTFVHIAIGPGHPASRHSRVFVIFLDAAIVRSAESGRLLITALDRLIRPADVVALMTPGMSAADVIFAPKKTTVEEVLRRTPLWRDAGRGVPVDETANQYRECYTGTAGIADTMAARGREKASLDALRALVRLLRGAREERKAVLVVTGGWTLYRPAPSLMRPIAGQARTGVASARTIACDHDRLVLAEADGQQALRDIIQEANRANASFYPIDTHALQSPADSTASGAREATAGGDRAQALRALADDTDGVAVLAASDLAGAFDRAAADLSTYYLIGYDSTARPDGKFHSLAVRVKRPGVLVRTRRGFVADVAAEVSSAARDPAPAAGAATRVAGDGPRALESIIAPLDRFDRDVPLRTHVVAWRTSDNVLAVSVVAEAGPGEDWMGGGDAQAEMLDAAGKLVATAKTGIDPGARSVRMMLTPAADAPPGAYDVRVRVKGAGSVVPTSDTTRITLTRRSTAAGAVFLRRGPTTGNRLMPTADLRFRRSDHLMVEVPTLASDPVSARLLDRRGKPIAVPVTASVRVDADGSRWHTAQLAVAPLAVGDYVIELSSESSGRTLVAFRVIP